LYKIPAKTLFMGQKLIYVPECHSTNSLLTELADQSELPEGTVLITDNQTTGRGQRGNTWESQAGVNLTFSILLRPGFLETKDQFQLSMAVAIGVGACFRDLISRVVSVKWPNDIFVEDQKVGGILIENQTHGSRLSTSIVGIGLNINQAVFPIPLAASLLHFTGKVTDLNMIFSRLLGTLEASYLDLRTGNSVGIRSRYIESLYRFNKEQTFESAGKKFVGVITDIDEYGRLCVQEGEERRKFSLQEIRMIH